MRLGSTRPLGVPSHGPCTSQDPLPSSVAAKVVGCRGSFQVPVRLQGAAAGVHGIFGATDAAAAAAPSPAITTSSLTSFIAINHRPSVQKERKHHESERSAEWCSLATLCPLALAPGRPQPPAPPGSDLWRPAARPHDAAPLQEKGGGESPRRSSCSRCTRCSRGVWIEGEARAESTPEIGSSRGRRSVLLPPTPLLLCLGTQLTLNPRVDSREKKDAP